MKNYSISIIRMIATISVFLCHITQYLHYNILSDWFNLGVQLFFVISAFLYSDRKIKGWIAFVYRRCIVILVPCMIYILICILIEFILGNKLNIGDITSPLIGIGDVKGTPIYMHFWYITYILFLYAVLPILQKIRIYKIKNDVLFLLLLGIPLLFIAIIQYVVKQKAGVFTLSVAHLSCFIVPYYIMKRNGKEKISKTIFILLLIVAAIINCLAIVMRYNVVYIEWIVDPIKEQLYLYGHTFAGIVLFYILYELFKRKTVKDKTKRFFDLSDRYSLYIYIVHPALIHYGCVNLIENRIAGGLLTFALSIVCSIILHKVSEFIKRPMLKIVK